MSIRATNFVRRLRGLTPTEKAVAFVLADHAHVKTGEISISMTTAAEESGVRYRQNASEIVSRLVTWKVFLADGAGRKLGRGRPTIHRLNYGLENCDSPVAVSPLKKCMSTTAHNAEESAVPDRHFSQESAVESAVRDPEKCSPNAQKVSAQDCTKGLRREMHEGKEGAAEVSHGFSSRRSEQGADERNPKRTAAAKTATIYVLDPQDLNRRLFETPLPLTVESLKQLEKIFWQHWKRSPPLAADTPFTFRSKGETLLGTYRIFLLAHGSQELAAKLWNEGIR